MDIPLAVEIGQYANVFAVEQQGNFYSFIRGLS
jgi:hypothetical protein